MPLPSRRGRRQIYTDWSASSARNATLSARAISPIACPYLTHLDQWIGRNDRVRRASSSEAALVILNWAGHEPLLSISIWLWAYQGAVRKYESVLRGSCALGFRTSRRPSCPGKQPAAWMAATMVDLFNCVVDVDLLLLRLPRLLYEESHSLTV
jgi:hypothetical protein